MDLSHYDVPEDEDAPAPRPRDVKIDEAKELLVNGLFGAEPEGVFYQRQVEIIYEELFFHWITTKALKELSAEHRIRTEVIALSNNTEVRFYWSNRNRYYRRKRKQIQKLIEEHASFNQATGTHAETMFDAALPREGFLPKAYDVRAYEGRLWTMSDHNLDWVFERDGVAYGTEIKNTMDYIDQKELKIKLRLKPLFIMRYAPKSYVYDIQQRGGYALLFRWQLLPHGLEDLARRLRDELRLPVDCPKKIADGTTRRFLNWHLRQLGAKSA